MGETTFILVHGAWHGAWCWRDVGAALDARAISWRALDLPSSHDEGGGFNDLATDANALVAMASVMGPVILVGHSYGGAVISEAASRIDQLVETVYVAALVPNPGQSASEAARTVKVRTVLDNAIEIDGPFLRLNRLQAADGLYGECTSANQEWALAQIGEQTLASFRQGRQSPDSGARRRYLLCRNDQALDPSLQAEMAKRCDQVVEIESDHSPFLSHPHVLVDFLTT